MKNIIIKEIPEYLIRIFIFLLLNRGWAIKLYLSLLSPIIPQSGALENGVLFLGVSFIFYWYITIKICGLFKKLDKLNFFISIAIVLLIDVLYNNITFLTRIQLHPLRFSYYYQKDMVYVVLTCFILYKIFYFLGKKFPKTFGKIGYYTSLEFWKNLVLKLGVK